ncbi:MAG: hypothetical protein KDB07_11935, partial [Planctomycetes bacterium]|nr:hypothetical protein [Planctomycetota bacterium]
GSFNGEDFIKQLGGKVKGLKSSEEVYFAYLLMKSAAKGQGKAARKVIEDALSTDSWPMLAALQAIQEGGDPSWVIPIYERLKAMIVMPAKDAQDQSPTLDSGFRKDLLEGNFLLAVGLFDALSETYPNMAPDEKRTHAVLDQMITMITLLDEYDYVRYFAAKCFAKIAGFKQPSDNRVWLKHYLLQREMKRLNKDGMPEDDGGTSRTRVKGPTFVGMPPIGKRIVICLDVSGSMEEEVSDEVKETRKKREGPITGDGKGKGGAEEKEKEKGHRERIDWAKIKTKLDLAKADFKLTLQDMSDDYYFNVVAYSTDSDLLDPKKTGFVRATEANKAHFIKLVEDVETQYMTNIHGALMDALRITSDGADLGEDEDPSTSSRALLTGANTIFFLTDGYGTWSDDSVNKKRDKRISNSTKPSVGDGAFIYREDIIMDFVRLNKFRKVIVNTVGIGNHDRWLMFDMAKQSGGQYIDLSGKKPLNEKNRKDD